MTILELPDKSEPEATNEVLSNLAFQVQMANRSGAAQVSRSADHKSSCSSVLSTCADNSKDLQLYESHPGSSSGKSFNFVSNGSNSLFSGLNSEHRSEFLRGSKDRLGAMIQNPDHTLMATLGVMAIASQSKIVPRPAAWGMLAVGTGLLMYDELKDPVTEFWRNPDSKSSFNLAYKSGSFLTQVAVVGVAPFLLGRSRFRPF